MHDKPKDASDDDRASTAAQDLHDQGVVLIRVLTIYPTHLRLLELIREIAAESANFAEGDRIERAVCELAGVGLLFRCEGVVLPTRAALQARLEAGATGLEPATSGVTGRRSNQLSYAPERWDGPVLEWPERQS